MNKKEIQNKLDQANYDRDTLTENILELQKQLAKAEKPKLRHGDFGVETHPFVVIEQASLYGSPKAFYSDQSGQIEANKNMSYSLCLGNIFDLLKKWNEDLEEFEIKGAGEALLKARIACDRKSFIFTLYDGSKSSPIVISIPAEEIWHKFGQLIATLKKKKG